MHIKSGGKLIKIISEGSGELILENLAIEILTYDKYSGIVSLGSIPKITFTHIKINNNTALFPPIFPKRGAISLLSIENIDEENTDYSSTSVCV